LKLNLEAKGWYIRKAAGLPTGVDLFTDLRKFGVNPKCMFDIAAYEGQTALEYARAFPTARVFAFEPVSSNYAKLAGAIARESRITPVQAAVGSESGKAMINLHPGNSQSHSIARTRTGGAEEVDVTTIDTFCAEHALRPDFIKIDVEGFELQVIPGGMSILAANWMRAVIIETTLNPDNRLHTQFNDLAMASPRAASSLLRSMSSTIGEDAARILQCAIYQVRLIRLDRYRHDRALSRTYPP
jgi:FkbM family methyltransferase